MMMNFMYLVSKFVIHFFFLKLLEYHNIFDNKNPKGTVRTRPAVTYAGARSMMPIPITMLVMYKPSTIFLALWLIAFRCSAMTVRTNTANPISITIAKNPIIFISICTDCPATRLPPTTTIVSPVNKIPLATHPADPPAIAEI